MSNFLIAIDNGHGHNTPGKRTPVLKTGPRAGTIMHEWEFNRAVALKLSEHLKRCGFNTMLVSNTSDDTPLATRAQRAIDGNANMFVSIHANAGGNSGWYTTSPLGVEVLYHSHNEGNTIRFAGIMESELRNGTRGIFNTTRSAKVSNWALLGSFASKKIPAIITENGFMDSEYDAPYLVHDLYRETIAIAHAKAICKYFNKPYLSQDFPVITV